MNAALKKRVITAAILIPLLILAIFYAPAYFFMIMIMVVFAACAYEGASLLMPAHSTPQKGFFAAFVALSIFVISPKAPALALLAVGFWGGVLGFFMKSSWRDALKRPHIALPVLWLCLVPAACSVWFLRSHFSPETLLAILLVVFASDTAAYFVGKRFGTTKLAPMISPGKTRAGFLGGVIGAALAGLILSPFLSHSFCASILLSILIALVGTWGDLFESILKRVANVKDSGKLLPGHGGLLDRMDSLFAVLPVVLAIKVLL